MRVVLFLICLWQLSNLSAQTNDPVLFTIGEDPVYLSEFKYIYEKNNADKADYSTESLDEYLELYKKFKLKVRRARSIGLDTVQSLNDELAGYRKQLAKSYLKDKELSNKLVDQILERMQEDIAVKHIFVSSPQKTPLDKQEAALKKINDIYDKLEKNNGKDFDRMAKTLSEDKASALRSGSLGYYTSPLPDGFYTFENAMYETEVGGYSKPVKSKMGYHIIKVTDRRPARGQMEIAHILFRNEKSQTSFEDKKILADSVYNMLSEGRSFENFAAKFSDDTKTKSTGGYLGFFGINQYEVTFEDAAFALKKDGDFTTPIKTQAGYHIIKRISKRNDDDKERLRKRVEARLGKGDRFLVAEEKLIEDVKKEANFNEDMLSFKRFTTSLDEQFYTYKWQAPTYENNLKLFSLDGKDYTLENFAQFAKSNVRERLKFSKNTPYEKAAQTLYKDFVKEKVMEFEENNLERKYPDFKALMQEYREGILLFEITKREVWDKASQDTIGLQNFYNANSNNYVWPERVRAYKYELTSQDNKKIEEVQNYAKKKDHNKLLDKYKKDNSVDIKFSTVVLNKEDKAIEKLELKKDAVSGLTISAPPVVFYRYIGPEPSTVKSLSEARGYVIADYQDELETEWIKELKNTYPIKVDQKVLKSITK
jgi:peptidyl-prolyl cis-trans isomerase SurA